MILTTTQIIVSLSFSIKALGFQLSGSGLHGGGVCNTTVLAAPTCNLTILLDPGPYPKGPATNLVLGVLEPCGEGFVQVSAYLEANGT